MDWNTFKDRFHVSWHPSVKKWVESKDSAKVYAFLRSRKGIEIAPKSNLTFRPFEKSLNSVKIVVFFEEPYNNKHEDAQYADGIPLSCEYAGKIHSQLNEFYNAMEREFYGLNLNIIKENNLDFYRHQGVLFLNSSLTTEIGSFGRHKTLWESFNGHLIKNVFCKKNIPIIFCGETIYQQYRFYLDPLHPYFIIKQSLNEWKLGTEWNTEGKFLQANDYLFEKTDKDDIIWVNQDVPF